MDMPIRGFMKTVRATSVGSLQDLEARKHAIREKARKRIEAAKKARTEETKALARLERQLRAKEADNKKKGENHSKILLGIVLIDMANHEPALKAKIEAHARQFFAKSPGRLEAALNGLSLTVTKPESEAWQEDL